MSRVFRRACIIGCGLIGGSVGLALRRTGRVRRVVGVDSDPETLAAALTRGAIDESAALGEALRGADLIVVATPVPVALGVMREVAEYERLFAPRAIVTDVCSTKVSIARQAARCLSRTAYVGGHPMAGSEKSGILAADAKLLENAVYVLTRDSATDGAAFADLEALVRDVRARVTHMSPQEHDRVVAAISHVPHVVAAALVNQVAALAQDSEHYPELAAGGFRDITRIASSEPALWRDIALDNEREIALLLDDWTARIEAFKRALAAGDSLGLESFFSAARSFRDALPARATGAIGSAYSFTVSVSDEPGVIGDVASMLGREGVSIRNIGILESREGDDGQLLLQFDQLNDHDRAIDILQRHGYGIADRP